MKKRTGLVLFGLGAAATAAAAIAASKQVTKNLVGEALDRDEPQLVKNVTVKLIDSYMQKEPYKSALKLSEKLENTPMEALTIESDDGLTLVGHWYPAEGAKRIILAMHGWRSTWSRDFGAIADFWHDNGCSVLFAEQRGQGNSGGEYMGFGMTERYDCQRWINLICERTEDLPVYLAGISMGAATVLMASGLELPQRVHGIMADCGFTSANDIFRHVVNKTLHLSYNLRRSDVEAICREKIRHGADEYTTRDALAVNTRPVLFIHGTDDSFVPVSHTYENYKVCKAEKRLFVVPGADHGGSYLVDKAGYEKEVLDFFNKYDAAVPQTQLREE